MAAVHQSDANNDRSQGEKLRTTNTLTENDDREEDGKKRVMLPNGPAIFGPVKQ